MIKHLLFFIAGFVIILSCKKDNGSTDGPSTGGGSDKDWTISTSSTFHLKDMLDVVYVQDNKNDERLESIVTLSKLANKNNPNLKGEFQFVIDYDGKSNLNISQPIAFTNADFISNESIEKKVSIVLLGNTSKIGTIKMKMREKLNDKWTEYKYADKVYQTAYVKAGSPTIVGPDQVEKEATYTITNATEVVLLNADNIATIAKVTETTWKVSKIREAYGTVTIKATNKDKVSVVKEVVIGTPLPEIDGPASIDNEATYIISNAEKVVLENADKIASITKLSDTQYKVTKIGTAYGNVTIKATNKAGAVAIKEVTVGVPLPTITGAASFETEATYTIINATAVVLENNSNIATLTKVNETTYKVIKVGTAYGRVTIKATNKAGAVASKVITVGVPLPTIVGADVVETESTYTITNAASVVLENNTNIATLTKVTETSWKVTKVGTAYGKVTIKATNKAGASVSKNITVGTEAVAAPTISGSTTVCQEEIYTIKNATNVTLENASGIATLTSLGNDQWRVTKIGDGLISLNASGSNGNVIVKQVIVGTPAPILNGSLTLGGGEMGLYSVSSIDPNSKVTYSISDGANLYVVEYDSEFEFRIFMSERFLGRIPVEITSTNKCGISSITIFISRY